MSAAEAESIMLSVERAAKLCGVSVDTFERWVADGVLPKPADLPIRKRLWHRDVLNEALRKKMAGADDRQARRREWEYARPKNRARAAG
jgi:excisionase family DNA binding protein